MYIDAYIQTTGLLQTQNLQLIHTQARNINSNTRLKRIIKPQEERTREEGEKRATKTNPKQLIKWQEEHTYNYLQCKWTQCPNPKAVNDLVGRKVWDGADIGWLNGYEHKIHTYPVLKRPTSLLRTHIH